VLLAAAVLAALAHPARPLSPVALAITAVAFLLAAHVQFPIAAGWTRPTQLVFVPMLFVLPVTVVPFVVMVCLVADVALELRTRTVTSVRVLTRIADSAYTLGPVLVLVLAHAQRFGWSHWPVYVVALAAQLAVDYAGYAGRSWLAEGMVPAAQAEVVWAYVADICLSCAGVLIAASAVQHAATVVLSIPMLALAALFSRERHQRLDNAVALSAVYRGTALLLGDVIEDDDEYTGIHSRQVVELSLAVADRLGLDPSQRRNVEFGALLHDVGKIRVPKEIIHKPGKLSEDEWAVMREHTVFGEEMLRKVGGTLSSVGTVVRHSHERYDGAGYPDGLAGEVIPVESRIVCACDAFNAMTTTRPYRQALAQSEAVAELERSSGSHFDPIIVSALLATVEPAVPTPLT
jgi:putative nucleotidyltransferase with HDIG domain